MPGLVPERTCRGWKRALLTWPLFPPYPLTHHADGTGPVVTTVLRSVKGGHPGMTMLFGFQIPVLV